MPNPPNHWVMLRHRRMEEGSHSTEAKTVAPVLVMPLMDSKRASVKLVSTPVAIKGMAPKRASTIHINTTRR